MQKYIWGSDSMLPANHEPSAEYSYYKVKDADAKLSDLKEAGQKIDDELASKDRDLADAKHMLILANNSAAAFQRVAEQRQGEIERLERAVEWMRENAEFSTNYQNLHLLCWNAKNGWREWRKVPDDFADIIKPTTGASND